MIAGTRGRVCTMSPDEVRALARFRRRNTITMVLLFAVCLGVCGFCAIYPLIDAGSRQHLLGQSHQTRAEVVAEDSAGRCRGGTRYDYTLEWTEDDAPRTETITRCGHRWEVGEVIDIWSTDEDPYTEGPARWWPLLIGFFVVFSVMGAWTITVLRRGRRATAAVLSGTPPAASFPAIGSRTHHRLRVTVPDRHGNPTTRRVRTTQPLHAVAPTVQTAPDAPVSGRLSVSDVRRGKPRGLAHFVGDDGSRRWHFLG